MHCAMCMNQIPEKLFYLRFIKQFLDVSYFMFITLARMKISVSFFVSVTYQDFYNRKNNNKINNKNNNIKSFLNLLARNAHICLRQNASRTNQNKMNRKIMMMFKEKVVRRFYNETKHTFSYNI